MKMILAGDTGLYTAADYNYFIYNCNRNKCQAKYTVPIPDLSKLQFFVYFGSQKPTSVSLEMVSTCSVGVSGAITANYYLIGQLPNGLWYGVFKNFTAPVGFVPTCFVITMVFTFGTLGNPDYKELRYFSEEVCIEDCGELMEIKACFPDKATQLGFDLNKIYYGYHNGDPSDALGDVSIRYFHKYYVRQAYILNTSQKTTFKSYLTRNFRSEIQKLYQLRCELVPEWYSNYLMAAVARGEITVKETMSMIAKKWTLLETNFELVEEDGKLWKPVVTLEEIVKQFFGCDSECLNGEAACLGNATGFLTLSPPGHKTFVFLGNTALQAGESIQYELREKATGIIIKSGSLIAPPLSFTVTNSEYTPNDKCYILKWRKVCSTDAGSFSFDYSDDFEVGGGAGAFSEWLSNELGTYCSSPANVICRNHVFEFTGSNDIYIIFATLCDGSAYQLQGSPADPLPAPICAREGTVVISGNSLAIASNNEDCVATVGCKSYQITVFGADDGNWSVVATLCDGSYYQQSAYVGDGNPAPLCAREGTVVISGNAIISSVNDCLTDGGCFTHRIVAPVNTGGAIQYTHCDGTVSQEAMAAQDILFVCARLGSITTSDPAFQIQRLEVCNG